MAAILFHTTVFAVYFYSIMFDVLYIGDGKINVLTYNGYGGKFKYLTFVNLPSKLSFNTLSTLWVFKRLPALPMSLSLFVHFLGFAVNGGGLFYDVLFISHNGEPTWAYGGFPGKFKHLTFWNQILQTVYFGFSIVNDLFGSNLSPSENPKARSSLQKIRDGVSASVIFPIGTFVVVAFWALYAVDRELVFPKKLDAIIPAWLNHVMHSTVIVFLLLEKFFVYIHHPRRSRGLLGTVFFASIYQAWILWIAYYADIWVYPVLQVLGIAGKAGFICGCWITLAPIYLLGERLTNALWAFQRTKLTKKLHSS